MAKVITDITKVGEVYKANDGERYMLTDGGWYWIAGTIKLVTSAEFGELCEAFQKNGLKNGGEE